VCLGQEREQMLLTNVAKGEGGLGRQIVPDALATSGPSVKSDNQWYRSESAMWGRMSVCRIKPLFILPLLLKNISFIRT
jgi:hypothetical protein